MQAEDGIRYLGRARELGDVEKRQAESVHGRDSAVPVFSMMPCMTAGPPTGNVAARREIHKQGSCRGYKEKDDEENGPPLVS